jgi:hypothetical protein
MLESKENEAVNNELNTADFKRFEMSLEALQKIIENQGVMITNMIDFLTTENRLLIEKLTENK